MNRVKILEIDVQNVHDNRILLRKSLQILFVCLGLGILTPDVFPIIFRHNPMQSYNRP